MISASDRRRQAAERQRRWRKRQRPNGRRIVVPVEIGEHAVDFLVQLGWLSEGESDDRQQVGEAIANMLRDAARNS